jgi:type IV secretion system protein VirB9
MLRTIAPRFMLTVTMAACATCWSASPAAAAKNNHQVPADTAIRERVVESESGDMVVVRPPALVDKIESQIADMTSQMTDGAEIATLSWSPTRVFTIAIRPGMFTTINFPRDEAIQQFAVSDPGAVQLQVNATTNTAMVKLTRGQAVTATAVSTKRTYFLRFVPALNNGPWNQGVFWDVGDPKAVASPFGNFASSAVGMAGGVANVSPTLAATGPGVGVSPTADGGEPNFDYLITGDAPFRPVAVWDNGRFTWIQFPRAMAELPAVFAVSKNGLSIVNYTVNANGTQILVNRLMPEFLLKLGEEDVHVNAKGSRR